MLPIPFPFPYPCMMGFPDGLAWKKICLRCRRHRRFGCNPWVRTVPCWRKMAIHSILDWKIPWTEEPGRLQSKGLQRVGHNWVTRHTHTIQCISYIVFIYCHLPLPNIRSLRAGDFVNNLNDYNSTLYMGGFSINIYIEGVNHCLM